MKNAGLALLVLFAAGAVYGAESGLIVHNEGELADGDPAYTGIATPWFSSLLGDRAELYLSANLKYFYENNGGVPFIPEMGRSVLSLRPSRSLALELGRTGYRDPTGFIAQGFFDGLEGSFTLDGGALSLGVFYTGLLYKKSAKILLSPADGTDYGDDAKYFAPSRILAHADYRFLNLFGPRSVLTLAVLAQFDLAGEQGVHSQYGSVNFKLYPLRNLSVDFSAAGCFTETAVEDPVFSAAAGGELAWLPQGGLSQKISLGMRWASGAMDYAGAFVPISSLPQGEVFTPRLSGLWTLRGAYTVRPHTNVSLELKGTYFMRADRETGSFPGLDASSDSPLLGGEIYGTLFWAPFSDLSVSFGGGAFFPELGGALDGSFVWKAALGLIFSL